MEQTQRCSLKKIVSVKDFQEISGFIRAYKGLAIDCELELLQDERFSIYDPNTIRSILQTQSFDILRSRSREMNEKATEFHNRYREQLLQGSNDKLMLQFAIEHCIPPVKLARYVLLSMYNKKKVSSILKYPFQLNNNLGANVEQCLLNDALDGPAVDMHRRLLGEEYEVKLKEYCDSLNLKYQDEKKLRELGFDKTPDVLLTVPTLYRGRILNWIESKAIFGDYQTFKRYLDVQLNSYYNRFGPGLVIYWFGYTEGIPQTKNNDLGILVLDGFPERENLELMQ